MASKGGTDTRTVSSDNCVRGEEQVEAIVRIGGGVVKGGTGVGTGVRERSAQTGQTRRVII